MIFVWIGFREERLRFWSDPDTELKLARDTGVTVFRMGIDWSRIVPTEPQNNLHDIVSVFLNFLFIFFSCMKMYNESTSYHVYENFEAFIDEESSLIQRK